MIFFLLKLYLLSRFKRAFLMFSAEWDPGIGVIPITKHSLTKKGFVVMAAIKSMLELFVHKSITRQIVLERVNF